MYDRQYQEKEGKKKERDSERKKQYGISSEENSVKIGTCMEGFKN